MHLDKWLNQVYDEEVLSKEASGLEILFDRMDPAALLEVACGRTTLEKAAAEMSQAQREDLSSKSFAVPESKAKKIGVADEIQGEAKGKYPIPDEKHARNALARVSQNGTPAEREAVRKKVYAKYPQLRESFEESHGGESPTSKENVKKEEQGGIGKTSQAKLVFLDKVARQIARQHSEVMDKVAFTEGIYQTQQKMEESAPLRGALGAGLGGYTGHRLGGTRGALIGGALGAGAGLLGSHLAKKKREAISKMGAAKLHNRIQLEKKAFFPGIIGTGIGAGIGAGTGYGAGRGAAVGLGTDLAAQLGAGTGAGLGYQVGGAPGALVGLGLGGLAGGYGGYKGMRALLDKKKSKSKEKTKEDEFTSPEAQAKAKVMQKSMSIAKGAPPPARKKAISEAANSLQGR